jgi:hypothetical protein
VLLVGHVLAPGEVARRWHALSVGEALTLAWPAQLTIRPGGSSRPALVTCCVNVNQASIRRQSDQLVAVERSAGEDQRLATGRQAP